MASRCFKPSSEHSRADLVFGIEIPSLQGPVQVGHGGWERSVHPNDWKLAHAQTATCGRDDQAREIDLSRLTAIELDRCYLVPFDTLAEGRSGSRCACRHPGTLSERR